MQLTQSHLLIVSFLQVFVLSLCRSFFQLPTFYVIAISCFTAIGTAYVAVKFMPASPSVPYITALYYHPIKSCAAIQVDELEFDRLGFLYDRRWCILSPRGTIITQRDIPSMALIQPLIKRGVSDADGVLEIRAPGMELLALPLHPSASQASPININVWGHSVDTLVYNDEQQRIHQWLKTYLTRDDKKDEGEPGEDEEQGQYRLVTIRKYEEHDRPVEKGNAQTEEPVEKKDAPQSEKIQVGLADGFPFLLCNESSLNDLNRHVIGDKVKITSFRPNIVIGGHVEPYAEDKWYRIGLGQSEFDVVNACARCSLPMVNQVTGKRHPEKEPVRSLRSHRSVNGETYFGQDLVHLSLHGRLRVGDKVTVLEAGRVPIMETPAKKDEEK